MSDSSIQALVDRNPGQATFPEYKLVHQTVTARAPCSMLVFGTGRDSPLWIEANSGGRTVFLEDNPEWIELARHHSPGIEVHRVRYPTLRILAPVGRLVPALLRMRTLPGDVRDASWDVILVDAPRGTRWYRPGRAMSIYTAAGLARRSSGCDVFVHDTHRSTERNACDWFLGAANFKAQAGTMRHYHLP